VKNILTQLSERSPPSPNTKQFKENTGCMGGNREGMGGRNMGVKLNILGGVGLVKEVTEGKREGGN